MTLDLSPILWSSITTESYSSTFCVNYVAFCCWSQEQKSRLFQIHELLILVVSAAVLEVQNICTVAMCVSLRFTYICVFPVRSVVCLLLFDIPFNSLTTCKERDENSCRKCFLTSAVVLERLLVLPWYIMFSFCHFTGLVSELDTQLLQLYCIRFELDSSVLLFHRISCWFRQFSPAVP